MKDKRKITSTIYLTEEQQTLLKELSRRSKVPVAEYIRQGIDLILKQKAHQLPGQLSFMLNKDREDKDKEDKDRDKKTIGSNKK